MLMPRHAALLSWTDGLIVHSVLSRDWTTELTSPDLTTFATSTAAVTVQFC